MDTSMHTEMKINLLLEEYLLRHQRPYSSLVFPCVVCLGCLLFFLIPDLLCSYFCSFTEAQLINIVYIHCVWSDVVSYVYIMKCLVHSLPQLVTTCVSSQDILTNFLKRRFIYSFCVYVWVLVTGDSYSTQLRMKGSAGLSGEWVGVVMQWLASPASVMPARLRPESSGGMELRKNKDQPRCGARL